jgi:hypothetical protein
MKLFKIILFITLLLNAELPPSAYTSMQDLAENCVVIKVIDSNESIDIKRNILKVKLKAKVLKVYKSKTLKIDDTIDIHYNKIYKLEPFFVGPASTPTLPKKTICKAYLNRDGKHFIPAAKSRSFLFLPSSHKR